MEKRLIIAVILSIGVLYAYSFIFPPAKAPQVLPGTAKQAVLSSATAAPTQAGVVQSVAAVPVAASPGET